MKKRYLIMISVALTVTLIFAGIQYAFGGDGEEDDGIDYEQEGEHEGENEGYNPLLDGATLLFSLPINAQ